MCGTMVHVYKKNLDRALIYKFLGIRMKKQYVGVKLKQKKSFSNPKALDRSIYGRFYVINEKAHTAKVGKYSRWTDPSLCPEH